MMGTICCLLAAVSVAYAGTLMEELTTAGATTLVDLLKSTGLNKSVDNDYLTIFAPTNEAFAALPDDLTKTLATNSSVLMSILQFHATHGIFRAQDAFNDMLLETLLAGSKIRVNLYQDNSVNPLFITLNGAKVLRGNIQASNDVLHVVDTVMFPPLGTFYTLVEQSASHSILKDIIDAQGMRAAVEKILLYHILGNVVYSAGAQNGTYTTLDHGETLTVTVAADRSVYKINQATVILGDLPATNGVLHIVDSVLVPEPYASALIIGK